MNTELGKLKERLNVNKLSLNVAKTEFIVIGSRQRLAAFDDNEISVIVGNDQQERVENSKSLGLTTDVNLTWKEHIDKISKIVFERLGWNNLHTKRKMQKAVLMYKVVNSLTPTYLEDLVIIDSKILTANCMFLNLEQSCGTACPESLRSCRSLSSFKRSFKK